jgi:hypothetical protein
MSALNCKCPLMTQSGPKRRINFLSVTAREAVFLFMRSTWQCLLLALNGHRLVRCKCPLSGGITDMGCCSANVCF